MMDYGSINQFAIFFYSILKNTANILTFINMNTIYNNNLILIERYQREHPI